MQEWVVRSLNLSAVVGSGRRHLRQEGETEQQSAVVVNLGRR